VSARQADPAALTVRAAAAECADLAAIAAAARDCVACAELASTRTHVVVGDFPAHARLMLVGEAPGAQEDLSGHPFVGRGGQLLDGLLRQAGIDRSQVAVANVAKCRPPGNRTPTRLEAQRCTGWLDRQVQLVAPDLVVTLGGTALAWSLGNRHPLRDVRGRIHAWRDTRLLPTYHPSAALRFGPHGEPLAALRADLILAAQLCN
jgi:uracil-DNA glycosylase family 4